MIIGITGFISAGKGELTNILVKNYGFIPLSTGDAVRAEAVVQKIENTRTNLQALGDSMRHKHGGDFWIRRLLEKVEAGKDYVFEGIRNVEEITILRTMPDFHLICVDASLEVRAQRVFARKRTGDAVTMEKFLIDDAADKGEQAKGYGQNTAKCVILADYVIHNDSTLDVLAKRTAQTLAKIDKKRFGSSAKI